MNDLLEGKKKDEENKDKKDADKKNDEKKEWFLN
jgi:hypothetical protein